MSEEIKKDGQEAALESQEPVREERQETMDDYAAELEASYKE